jgi:UDP-glucose 4-epimerase
MTTLITGAGGFLGGHLREVFRSAGHQVRAVDLPGTADMDGTCDVTDQAQVEATMQGVDTLIHAAGIFDLTASESALFAVNADGAERMVTAAADAGARKFVLISSTGVYGRGADNAVEDDPKSPEHPYARSKWEGERRVTEIAQQRGLSLAVLRPTLLYGPGSRYGLAPWAAIFALRRLKGAGALPISSGGPLGHMVHATDVAKAALHVSQADIEGVFNVSDDAPVPAGDLVRLIADAIGAPVSGSPLPWGAMRVFRRGKPLIVKLFASQNAKLAHLWRKIVEEHDLVPALAPRLDADWIDFLSADHTYDSSALRATGFEFSHPDARTSFPQTIDWYRQQRWIPAA